MTFESWLSSLEYGVDDVSIIVGSYNNRYYISHYGDGIGFSARNGSGSSAREGCGIGTCDGEGTSNVDGFGHGSGDGDGTDNIYGSGYGTSRFYRDGTDFCPDFGINVDCGRGYGCGCSTGSGFDDCLGYGGPETIFLALMGKSVKIYYIDGITCIPRRIRNQFALVDAIGRNKRPSKMVLIKGHGLIAHGKTVREAAKALEAKRLAKLDVETRTRDFLAIFNSINEYSAKDFFIGTVY